MAKRKIGGLEEDAILTGGLVLGGWLLFKHIFPSTQVSDADKQTLDEQQTTDSSANIFNAYSKASTDWSVSLPDWGGYSTWDDYLVSQYRNFLSGNMNPNDPFYQVMEIYMQLNNALIGHFYNGDQSGINNALNMITNQWQVGVLANIFLDINGVDLWSNLRNGSFVQVYGLNGADLASQVKRLNNLPD